MPPYTQNIKKIGITMEGQDGQYLELDQKELLKNIITEICQCCFHLSNPGLYSLQFTGPNHGNIKYITERNRGDIQDGDVLKLTLSPTKTVEKIIGTLRDEKRTKEEQLEALTLLADISVDTTFAQEFIAKNGMQFVINLIENGTYTNMHEAQVYTLKAFVELMEHGIVSWDVLETPFIKMVASEVKPIKTGALTLPPALQILESIVLHSSEKYGQVEQEVTPVNLLPFLQSTNGDTQKNAIALINALFLKADLPKRKKIADDLQSKKSIRNVILLYVMRKPIAKGAEMAHQLYVLQSLLFSLLEDRRLTPIASSDQEAFIIAGIQELRKIVFDTDPVATPPDTSKRQSHTKDHKKLGFQNHVNPVEDFTKIPPGLLALDVMLYFAQTYKDDFTKVVLENCSRADDHGLPFAQASIELTNLLCDILKVGEPHTDEGTMFHMMFFTHDNPFEEFYCICIQLLNKTWRDMKATTADLSKVLSVVKEQVTRAMEIHPPSFDHFKAKISKLTYSEITKIWKQERRNKEEGESQARPILELREQFKPEILELVKHQRLNYLVEGTQFTKYHPKGTRMKDKFWYCRLAPNHKAFFHGDCNEGYVPTVEQLPNKLAVVDIMGLVMGKDCPHIKERKAKIANAHLAFSIVMEQSVAPEPLNFIAPSQTEFDMWVDGINALLGNPMDSEKKKVDVDILLGMEIKLRLLDTEGITIPESPPPIPCDPPNYDFVY